jgi:hypothetical protein
MKIKCSWVKLIDNDVRNIDVRNVDVGNDDVNNVVGHGVRNDDEDVIYDTLLHRNNHWPQIYTFAHEHFNKFIVT